MEDWRIFDQQIENAHQHLRELMELSNRSPEQTAAILEVQQALSASLEELGLAGEERLRRRNMEMAALNAIAAATSQSLELETVLDAALQETLKVLDAEGGLIYLLDEAGQAFALAAHSGIASNVLREVAGFKLGVGLSGQVAASGEALAVADLATDPRNLSPAAVGQGWRSYAGAPIRSKGKVLGVMTLVTTRAGHFGPDHVDLLSHIGSQIGMAVENARLYEQVQARSRYLETLQRINATLRSTLPLDEVLATIVRGAGEALGYPGALIGIPDPAGERLILGAVWGERFLGGVKLTGLEAKAYSLPLSSKDNLIALAYRDNALQSWHGEPEQIIADVEPALNPVLASLIGQAMGAEHATCIPLPMGEKVVGVLVIFHPGERLMEDERAMLLGLADQAGLAIEHARLYQAAQQEIAERKRVESQREAALEALRRSMEELKATQAQLIQTAKLAAVGELAAGVAHEINNPLTSILGFAELLLKTLPPDTPLRRDLEVIAKQATRARDIVRNLLGFAHQTAFRRRPCDINQVVQQTLDLMRQRLEMNGIVVEEHYAPHLGPLTLDSGQMKQVFLNLITNAAQAMPDGGRLRVSTTWVGDEVVVAVSDSGDGIPPELWDRIFDPFFTTKPIGQGTGLGLSVSLGIVQGHGGRITVESQVGQGSTFSVRLPVEHASPERGS
jgi:signal transduction histidine kinase/putative methionine-R-sulfoxide reductase with GAF domain